MGDGELDDEVQEELDLQVFDAQAEERSHLRVIVEALEGGDDPMLRAVRYFLDEHRSAEKTLRAVGSIIFSQYYDTAARMAASLSCRSEVHMSEHQSLTRIAYADFLLQKTNN